MKNHKLVLLTGAALAFLTWSWVTQAGLGTLPNVSLRTIDGRTYKLHALRGRPVLINFWASTCGICRREMPQLARLYQDHKAQGFLVIGIDMYYDPPNIALDIVKHRRITYPIVFDLDGRIAKSFGYVQATPTSILIAPDGKIIQRRVGAMNLRELRKTLQLILRPARTR